MDSKILTNVIEDMRRRELLGKEKYNCTMDRTDLTTSQWITHLKEELQDAILYLSKLENIHNGNEQAPKGI